MEPTIQWPDGEFTLQAAVALNASVSQAEIRKKLSAAIAAKKIVQTRKGDGKIQGAFKVVETVSAAGI
jgi:hypothetical protein